MIGRCTQSGLPCATVGDCPSPFEGCCGDQVLDGPAEGCDDGNRLDGDCCSATCQVEPAASCEPQSCPALGPHLVAAFVKRATTKNADRIGTSERWKTRGTFTLGSGQRVDPDTQPTTLEFSENGSVLYASAIPAGTFEQKHDVCPIQWKFTDAAATLPSAVGWKTARLKQSKLQGGARGACGATVQYNLGSGKNAPMAAPAGSHLRQSLRIGDDCFTALLACRPAGSGLTCETPATP